MMSRQELDLNALSIRASGYDQYKFSAQIAVICMIMLMASVMAMIYCARDDKNDLDETDMMEQIPGRSQDMKDIINWNEDI
jgi:hypothetical protein